MDSSADPVFWRRYARSGQMLNLLIVVINTAYVVATAATGPNRPALIAINGTALVGTAIALVVIPEERIAASPHPETIFAAWAILGSLLVGVATWLDGGIHSPMVWLFPLTVMFAASVHRPPLVLVSTAGSLACFLTVAAASHASLSATAVGAAYLVTLGYAAATTAHLRWGDHDAQVELTSRLSSLAERDGLTGLFNHAAFHEQLAAELTRSTRDGATLSVLLIDLDHFKTINDQYGHLAGDDVLKAVGLATVGAVRYGDVGARIGGEEFAVMLPNTAAEDAREVAERIRFAIAAIDQPTAITASIGMSVLSSEDASPMRLLQQADSALYKAKHSGRNRVCEEHAA